MLVPGLSVPCRGEIETPDWSDPPETSTPQSTLSDPLLISTTYWDCWPESQPRRTLVGVTWSEPMAGLALGEGDGVEVVALVAEMPAPAPVRGDGPR